MGCPYTGTGAGGPDDGWVELEDEAEDVEDVAATCGGNRGTGGGAVLDSKVCCGGLDTVLERDLEGRGKSSPSLSSWAFPFNFVCTLR